MANELTSASPRPSLRAGSCYCLCSSACPSSSNSNSCRCLGQGTTSHYLPSCSKSIMFISQRMFFWKLNFLDRCLNLMNMEDVLLQLWNRTQHSHQKYGLHVLLFAPVHEEGFWQQLVQWEVDVCSISFHLFLRRHHYFQLVGLLVQNLSLKIQILRKEKEGTRSWSRSMPDHLHHQLQRLGEALLHEKRRISFEP